MLSSSSSNKTLSFLEQFSSLCLTQLLPTCGWGRDAGGMQWMQRLCYRILNTIMHTRIILAMLPATGCGCRRKQLRCNFLFSPIREGRKCLSICLSVYFVANPFCCNPLCVALCFSFCRTNPFWFLHADFLSLLCCNSFAYFNKIEKDIVWSCIRVFFPLSCGRNPFECCLWFVSSRCLRDCWISSLSLSYVSLMGAGRKRFIKGQQSTQACTPTLAWSCEPSIYILWPVSLLMQICDYSLLSFNPV